MGKRTVGRATGPAAGRSGREKGSGRAGAPLQRVGVGAGEEAPDVSFRLSADGSPMERSLEAEQQPWGRLRRLGADDSEPHVLLRKRECTFGRRRGAAGAAGGPGGRAGGPVARGVCPVAGGAAVSARLLRTRGAARAPGRLGGWGQNG